MNAHCTASIGPGGRSSCGGRLVFALLMLALMAAAARPAQAADPSQADFATAEQAVDALAGAVRHDDQRETVRILGPAGRRLVYSGDRVADREARQRFVTAFDAAHRVQIEGSGVATLFIGTEDWPLPIPVVERGGRWHFDTQASAQKIIDRRVGRNELNVIEVCRAYVQAQREYAAKDRLGDGLREYAPRFESSAGKHDGLFWEPQEGEEASPFGPLVAHARAEGYAGKDSKKGPSPYHGYVYRIITRQGAHAPGGARDYRVDGHLTGGFALLAFPAKWGDSGIMTFMVNQDGIVFEKNLGPQTARLARAITEFDPDLSWQTP